MNGMLEKIETDVDQLSLDDQLLLLEYISQKVRRRLTIQRRMISDDLDRMASDPEIQRELRQIELEFTETEADGLDEL